MVLFSFKLEVIPNKSSSVVGENCELYVVLNHRTFADDEQDESPDSGENEPLLRCRVNKSESYTGVI